MWKMLNVTETNVHIYYKGLLTFIIIWFVLSTLLLETTTIYKILINLGFLLSFHVTTTKTQTLNEIVC